MTTSPEGAPRKCRALFFPAAVVLIGTALFFISVWQRASSFGDAGVSMAGWTTGGSAVTAANWYREGAWRLRFVMYWAPDSVELDALGAREPYISFPPGAIIPIYLMAKAARRDPTPAMVMGYSLFIHLLTTVTLGLLIYYAAIRMTLRPRVSAAFAIPAMALYLWLPSPYYEHQMGYFSDQAVMLPFALALLAELMLWNTADTKRRRCLQGLQALIQFWGVFTDWLFVFVAFFIWTLRVIRGDFGGKPLPWLKKAARYWLPAALAIALYAAQLWHLGAAQDAVNRFRLRAGVGEGRKYAVERKVNAFSVSGAFGAETRFWRQHMKGGYGPWARPLIAVSLAAIAVSALAVLALRLREKKIPPAWELQAFLGFLSLIPCMVYLLVFLQHCSYFLHGFTALKFALPIAVIPFGILPSAIASLLVARVKYPKANAAITWGIAILAMVLAGVCIYSLKPAREAICRPQVKDHAVPARFIGAHTGYADVVFSPDYAIADRPPQVIVYSMKQVHKIKGIEDIRAITDKIDQDFTLNLFVLDAKTVLNDTLNRLTEAATDRIASDGMQLIKIPKKAFYALLSEWDSAEVPMITSNEDSR